MSIINKTDDQKQNDVFFVCSLIEYIARQTHNERSTIVRALGEEGLTRLYNLADVYHTENIDKVSYDLQQRYHITKGQYDNLAHVVDAIPTHWDIGKVYNRLILQVARDSGENEVQTIVKVFTSWLPRKIDNYNSSMYCENNSYLTASYYAGKSI